MPKKSTNEWATLLNALVPKGHRWNDFWHLCSVFMDYVFGDKFESPKHCLVYIMYHSNWIDTNIDEYNNFTNEELAEITNRNLKLNINQEDVYDMLGTSRNTYKKNFAKYLDIPKQPKVGDVLLIILNKWYDSKRKIMRPISKKELASLKGMYHKKIAEMFVEVPQARAYFEHNDLTYENVKQFPPRLIEYFFEEIGEPERFDELVKQINKKDDLDFNQ